MKSTACKTFRFLTAEQIILLHKLAISEMGPTQPAMLESAVVSPMNVKHYAKQENIFQLAANLSEKIMKNHAFMNGNKRTALLAADMFLSVNGYQFQKSSPAHSNENQGISDALVAVTTKKWTIEQLGSYYESIATPIASWNEDILKWREGTIEY